MKQFWVWDAPAKEDQRNLVILFLRIFAGGLMMWHGFTKIADFQQLVLTFPDPFGFGRTLSLLLCIFAEAICAILIFWGLLTRLAAIVLTFNMAVASFITLLEAPLERKELALLYLFIFIVISVLGGGKYSIDWVIFTRKMDPKVSYRGTNISAFQRCLRMIIAFIFLYIVCAKMTTVVISYILLIIAVFLYVSAFWGYSIIAPKKTPEKKS